MVTDAQDTVAPKTSSTKEVQCQHTGALDEPQVEELALPGPAPLATPKSGRVGIFNAEDFLSRAQLNDKINNILRSPTKAPNGVRQRSVFTNNNPSPQATMRFVSSMNSPLATRMSSLSLTGGVKRGLERGNSSSSMGNSASVGTSTSVLAKECSSQTNNCGRSYMNMGMHAAPHSGFGVVPQSGAGYEAVGWNMDAGNITRSGKSLTGRFNSGYGYEVDGAYCMPQAHHTQQFPSPMPPPPFAMDRVSSRTFEFENNTPPPCPGSGPIAMSNGTIQLRLREGVRIDMTLDKAVRVLNQRSMVAAALSRNCSNSALIHPNGRILQSGSKVEIVTYDGMKANNFVRYAKMWYKGVSFTSESCALIYLVDTAGTRTTTDTFTDLTKDYTLAVFYDDSRHGPSFVSDAHEVIANSTYNCAEDGTEVYDINGFRITQAADGLVKVSRQHSKCLIRTSPGNGSATLTTTGIHCTASLGKTSHLFVRRNEKRMHFDGSCFIVRNAGHSAGFNENNLLIVY
ncbi:uncharacterized protein LOC6735244 [Drosophila simulans]|uniref:GD11446 n=1 Tax=Drosophila simulans TaxID=7240 RepID=B4QDP6_DROSI|nr:uncharacterized protein LOC6735244 [Drosophila simulans]EDX07802.1 GD11446 [Drosophila simulans]KMY95072.1 uncharacterized protein Dsimw501_GD11446 [Drosophila simulans]